MERVNKIFEYIQEFAPVCTKAQWDNCGILVGSGNAKVDCVLLSLDITNDVVDEAKRLGAQLIISHHPVIFNPLLQVESDSVVFNLIKNNINAVCMHTNLDTAVECGVNVCLAKALKLSNVELVQNEYIATGNTNRAFTAEEFADFVKQSLNCSGLRYTCADNKITSVAVSSGGGGFGIFKAKQLGVSAFVTGEIKHHEILFANEHGISVFDVGHFKSENVVIEPLQKKLAQRFENVVFKSSSVFSDKIQYR